jgi:type IV secretory pathway VirB4 component
MFNGETNVDLDNDFIVFGIKDLEEGMKDLAMFISLEYIWNKIKSGDKKKRLIIVDEAWMLMKNQSSALFLEKVAKTARKFNTGLSLVSQNVEDFMVNGGEKIISNMSMQILLRQNPKELEYLAKALGISESEQMILRTLDIGEALIYAGQNKTLVKIVSNEFEHELCDTTA